MSTGSTAAPPPTLAEQCPLSRRMKKLFSSGGETEIPGGGESGADAGGSTGVGDGGEAKPAGGDNRTLLRWPISTWRFPIAMQSGPKRLRSAPATLP
jgi:hypothetical protein